MSETQQTGSEPTSRKVTSACPLDCPDTCSIDVTVEDGRVTKIDGNHKNPLTQGFICAKVRAFPRHLYGEERLRAPLKRRGAKGEASFERLSWEDALDLVAAQLHEARERWGGEAILPLSYGGSNGYLTQDTTDARLFRRLGASRLARTVCAAPSARAVEGLYGKMPGVALGDYAHSKLIVVWGANPSATGIHHVPILREAQRRGARLVVVDPRRTPLAKQADLHLPVRPGTDLSLALAVLRWLFAEGHADKAFLERHATGADELQRRCAPWTLDRAADVAGIEASQIEAFAKLYAAREPAVVRCGWGPERNRNGGSAIAAILALPAVAGKFGVRGGGFTLSNSGAWPLKPERLAAEPECDTREINMNHLGRVLLEERDPPVAALFVYNCNPLMTLPRQDKVRAGLEREDLFTVVFDQVMTDTARYADLVLPATTFLEHRELRRGYGAYALQDAPAVIEPVGEARPNYRVFADLCHRLGLAKEGDLEGDEELARGLLAQSPRAEELRASLEGGGVAAPDFGEHPVQMVDIHPRTDDGKIHLVDDALDREAPSGLYTYRDDPAEERYPLALISPATSKRVSSTFGQLHRGQVALELHPRDAQARSIDSGDLVRVWNSGGEVRCHVRLSHDMRPGTAFLPKGLWSHNTQNGATANALAPDTLADLGGGACFNDARVQVEKITEDASV